MTGGEALHLSVPSIRDSTINLPCHRAKPVLADSMLGVLFMARGITLVHADDSAASGGVRDSGADSFEAHRSWRR
jgi:hypothetical protein